MTRSVAASSARRGDGGGRRRRPWAWCGRRMLAGRAGKAADAADRGGAVLNEAVRARRRMRRADRQVDVADRPVRRIAPALDDGVLQRAGELALELHARQLVPSRLLLCRRRSGQGDGCQHGALPPIAMEFAPCAWALVPIAVERLPPAFAWPPTATLFGPDATLLKPTAVLFVLEPFAWAPKPSATLLLSLPELFAPAPNAVLPKLVGLLAVLFPVAFESVPIAVFPTV